MPQRLATYFGRMLEVMLLGLMVTLTTIVIVAVIYRKGLNSSLSWYDEVAEIMLIWVTYFGSALAALRRKHIGFDGFLLSLPSGARTIGFIISEAVVIGFFLILTYGGWLVFRVVEGDSLVSLTWVPQQLPQSIIPIGGVLFIIAELLSMPSAWRSVRAGISLEHEDIEHEIKLAQEALKK
ncbi:MAG: TRAP transporter small permease [Hyphomicrobiales bacterium]